MNQDICVKYYLGIAENLIMTLSSLENQRKRRFSWFGLVFAVIALIGLLYLKLFFPVDPPAFALFLVRSSFIFGALGLLLAVFSLPRKVGFAGLAISLINWFLLIFGWPLYAVF